MSSISCVAVVLILKEMVASSVPKLPTTLSVEMNEFGPGNEKD